MREDQDEVVKQLRAMLVGIKELNRNSTRCLDFVYDVLLPADTRMRHSLIRGHNIQGDSRSWGRLFLFIGIGLLIFVWPRIATVSASTLIGYMLTILYLTYPLDGIQGWLRAFHSASIAVTPVAAAQSRVCFCLSRLGILLGIGGQNDVLCKRVGMIIVEPTKRFSPPLLVRHAVIVFARASTTTVDRFVSSVAVTACTAFGQALLQREVLDRDIATRNKEQSRAVLP